MNDKEMMILEKLNSVFESLKQETFSLEEASEYLKIPTESVEYYSKRQKQLSYINLGGRLVFRKVDMDEFLEKKLKKGYFI